MLAAHAAFHSAVAKATGNPLFELVARPLYHVSYGEEVVGRPARRLLGRRSTPTTVSCSTASSGGTPRRPGGAHAAPRLHHLANALSPNSRARGLELDALSLAC